MGTLDSTLYLYCVELVFVVSNNPNLFNFAVNFHVQVVPNIHLHKTVRHFQIHWIVPRGKNLTNFWENSTTQSEWLFDCWHQRDLGEPESQGSPSATNNNRLEDNY